MHPNLLIHAISRDRALLDALQVLVRADTRLTVLFTVDLFNSFNHMLLTNNPESAVARALDWHPDSTEPAHLEATPSQRTTLGLFDVFSDLERLLGFAYSACGVTHYLQLDDGDEVDLASLMHVLDLLEPGVTLINSAVRPAVYSIDAVFTALQDGEVPLFAFDLHLHTLARAATGPYTVVCPDKDHPLNDVVRPSPHDGLTLLFPDGRWR